MNYIFEDVKKRLDLALIWMFNSYTKLKSAIHKRNAVKNMRFKLENGMEIKEEDDVIEVGKDRMEIVEKNERIVNSEIEICENEYDKILIMILNNLQARKDQKDMLFSKFITQVPHLTDNSLELLKEACKDKEKYLFNMSTLSELIITRSKQRNQLIQILLYFTGLTNQILRENACSICLNLYERKQFCQIIEVVLNFI